ncbi:MAG: hypothetical protein M5U09_30510 [Gammaproteobacteria bacterium]|nr:hypothetical protein [Gammaproteobacteria bacterium]
MPGEVLEGHHGGLDDERIVVFEDFEEWLHGLAGAASGKGHGGRHAEFPAGRVKALGQRRCGGRIAEDRQRAGPR